MTDVEKRPDRSPVPADWTYAPAPESTEIVSLRERYGLFVGGEWVAPRSGEYFETISPRDETPLAQVAQAGEEDVRAATAAAREAFASWSALPGRRARQVPVPDRAHPRRAVARVRRARVAERRQADQGVA